MAHDPRDDVDMLFACFKCGVSPPPSALKDMKSKGKPARSLNGGSLAVDVKEDPSCSKRVENSSPHSRVRSCCPSATAAIKFRSGKMISPVVFYGSPQGVPVKRSSRILKLLQEIRIDLREESALVLRDAIWSTFPRQEDAVRFARTHPKSNVFSYQDHLTGQRRFLVSTYDEFWRRYIRMDSKLRHHYEVIQEGLPCHLYFDLEFNKKFNIDRNVDEMVDILISVTLNAVSEKYSIGGNLEWIVELDSSTEEKFSRHVILRLPKTAFKDNSHVGAFVYEICSRIACLRESNPHVNKLYIMKDSCCSDLANQLFLDTAVYSRNRCFRLAFSSKAGKSSFLVPTGRFKCKSMSEHQVFLESLICRMDEDCEKILICKMDLGCTKTLCFDSEVHAQNQIFPHEVASHAPRSDITSTYIIGRSPFPALDAFVESIASCGSTSGKIQSWYWFSAYGLIVYNMSRNRYCERIGREHKSNHVMYVVDFQRAGYYQKCHDPDCKGYRSSFRPLPWDAFPDSSTLSSSTQIENYKEVINVDIDLHVGKNNLDVSSLEDEQLLTDCCSNMSWWQEAIMLAECIENTRNVPDVSKSDVDIIYDDCSWWKDVEKIVSQVE